MPVQVRAGTGGDEAALFAGDLLRMYERAAALNGWRFEVRWLEDSRAVLGGRIQRLASVLMSWTVHVTPNTGCPMSVSIALRRHGLAQKRLASRRVSTIVCIHLKFDLDKQLATHECQSCLEVAQH